MVVNNMELWTIIIVSSAVSLFISIFIKIAIGVKWEININEIIFRKEREKSIEYRTLKDWFIGNQYNFETDSNGKLKLKGKNRKKYNRYIKLSKLFNQGKLQQ